MKNIFSHLGRNKPAARSRTRAEDIAPQPDPKKKDETAEDEVDPEKTDETAEGEDDSEKTDETAEEDADLEDETDEQEDPAKEKEAAFRKGIKEGRKRERDRAAAIFASPHAAGREALAATLAFTTNMPAKQIEATLAAVPAGKGGGLAAAMAGQQNPDLGGGGAPIDASAGNKLVENAKQRATASAKRA